MKWIQIKSSKENVFSGNLAVRNAIALTTLPMVDTRWVSRRGRRSRFQSASSLRGLSQRDDLFHDNRAHSIEAVLVDHGHPDPTAPPHCSKESRALDSLPAEPVGHQEKALHPVDHATAQVTSPNSSRTEVITLDLLNLLDQFDLCWDPLKVGSDSELSKIRDGLKRSHVIG